MCVAAYTDEYAGYSTKELISELNQLTELHETLQGLMKTLDSIEAKQKVLLQQQKTEKPEKPSNDEEIEILLTSPEDSKKTSQGEKTTPYIWVYYNE